MSFVSGQSISDRVLFMMNRVSLIPRKVVLSTLPVIILLFCGGCGYSGQKKIPGSMHGIRKIKIFRDQVYDLSGYAGSGGGNPFNLFDENALVDPRYEKEQDVFIPVTNCQPTKHPAIYFHGSAGNRIVVDLKIFYLLKDIYLYDGSNMSDSLWIFTGSMKKWKKVAGINSGLSNGGHGWRKISLNDSSRFVMIQFSSYETAVTEMVLYGIPTMDIPVPDEINLHKGFTKTPLNEFLGVNYVMEDEPRFVKPFHYSRIYNVALDFDNDTGRQENKIRFNMLHYGYFNNQRGKYIFDIDTLQRINQGNIWFSIRGVSGWMNNLGFSDKDRPVNYPGLESEIPSNYSRHAKMMWHMAAFFGSTIVDSNLMSLSHEPRQSGRGSMTIFENGNEEDAPWVGNKYCSPYEYFAQSEADWDGDEGRMGKQVGIHNADPHAKLMMSGLVGLDTNRVKTYRFLAENLRDDHQFIWQGGIQYHYYAQTKGKGISPEADSMRLKLAKVADCSYRIAPQIKCFLGENGYDKSAASWQSTPMIPGVSASRSQAVMLLRSINATFFSGFDAYILYWLRDRDPEDDPRVFLTSGLVYTNSTGKTKVYPGWYFISTLVNRLGNYRPDQVIFETGDVWIYRYRHINQSDSVAYFVYKPTVNGTRLPSYPLVIGNTMNNQVQKISFLDDSEFGREEMIPVLGGKIMIPVEEKPALYLCKEPSSGK